MTETRRRMTSFEKENFMASFAVQLKRAREVLGFSREDLAGELHVSTSAVRSWEEERNLPNVLVYRRVKRLFKDAAQRAMEQKKGAGAR